MDKITSNEVGKIYERPWGSYQTLAIGKGYQVKIIKVNPEGCLSLQKHFKRAEHWVVVKGRPTATVNERVFHLSVGESIDVAKEATHRLQNQTKEPVEIIEIQLGEYLGEDDIVRLEDIYGRIS